MAQQQAREEVGGPTVTDVTSSNPNTPLSKSRTEKRRLRYGPAASGEISVSPSSTPCLPLAGRKRRSHVSCASSSAATSQLKEAPAHVSALTVSDECDPSSAALVLPCNPENSLFGRRCGPYVDLLLAAACLSCQITSRQVLEQHVRRRKFKASCKALTGRLRLRLGQAVAPAFPAEEQWPLLGTVASLCTLNQQCTVLMSAQKNTGTPDSSCSPASNFNDFSIALPHSDGSVCSAQAQRGSGAGVPNISYAHAVCFPFSGTDDATAGKNVFTDVDLSCVAAADWSTKGIHLHPALQGDLLAYAGKDEPTSAPVALSAVEKQRTFLVQHIRICYNVDGTPEIAFQIIPPAEKDKDEAEDSVFLRKADALDDVATEANRAPDASDASGNKSGKEAATFAERKKNIHGVERRLEPEAASAPARVDIAIGFNETERASAASRGRECSRAPSAPPCCTSVIVESSPSLSALVRAEARAGGAVAIPPDAPSTVAVEECVVGEEHGIARGADNKESISTEVERSDAFAATVEPPVARLTLQQLRAVVDGTRLCCDTLDTQLQCFAKHMSQLRQLSQLEAALHTDGIGRRDNTRTAGAERHVDSGDHHESGDSSARRTNSITACNDAGGGNISSEASSNVRKEVYSVERPQDKAPRGDVQSRGLSSSQDWTGVGTASLSPLHQQQLHFLSRLLQLRLPRNNELTAADVLGLSSPLDTTTTAESFSQNSALSQDATARSADTPAALSEEATVAAATTTVKQGKTGGPLENSAEEKVPHLPRGLSRGDKQVAHSLSASAADEISTVAVAAVGTDEDVRQRENNIKGSKQQKRRIVSLAEVPDLSVLERDRESAVAARRSHEQAFTGGNLRRDKEAALRRRVAEAMESVGDAVGFGGGKREVGHVQRHSSGSSVILLEPSEVGGDGDVRTGDVGARDISPSEKMRNGGITYNDAEDMKFCSSPAAGDPPEEEDELSAGIREIEALREILRQESAALLELVTFYENFSAECLRHAMQDLDASDGECSRSGECV